MKKLHPSRGEGEQHNEAKDYLINEFCLTTEQLLVLQVHLPSLEAEVSMVQLHRAL